MIVNSLQEKVSRATADTALHEMLFSGGALNAKVLGYGETASPGMK